MSSDSNSGSDPLDGIIAEYVQAVEEGHAPHREELLAKHPELQVRLRSFFADFDAVGRDASKFRLPDPQETVSVTARSWINLPTVRYLGDYELLEEIARGGMGVVYRARQVSLNRIVALKMILAGTYATPEAVQRFRAEAEAAANLDHPNILPIHEVGEHEGHQYFSMKLIDGGSLSTKIDEFSKDPKGIAVLMTKLARGIHYAHQRGILHRDLKPANVLLDADGTPYISDFGLAKKVDADDGSTRTGSIVGTPSYMAPEQARGEKGLTTAVDVYSLGAILYELLTGTPPFKGETVFATVKQVLEQEPAKPEGDRDLATIALKCLSKDPTKRYTSAGELADDLERYTRGEAITARPVGRVEKINKWMRRNKTITALGLFLFLAMCFGIGMFILAAWEADRRAIEAESNEMRIKVALDATTKVSLALHESEQLAQARLYGSQIRLAQSAQDQNQVGQAKRALADTDPNQRGWEYAHLQASVDTSFRTVKLTRSAGHHLALSPDGKTLGSIDSSDSMSSLKLAKDAREVDRFSTTRDGFTWSYGQSVGRDLPSCLYAEDQRSMYLFAVDGLKHHRFDDGKTTVFGHANPKVFEGEKKSYMGALAYSPDKKRLYSAGRGKLTCWNRADLKEDWSVEITDGECWAVAVSADETRFAMFLKDDKNSVKVYDRKEEKWIFSVKDYNAPHLLMFSPDAKSLYIHCNFRALDVWDVATGKLASPTITERSSTSAIDPVGTVAIQGTSQGDVVFFDLVKLKEVARVRAHADYTPHIAISPNGQYAATASADKTIVLWDVPNRKRLRTLTGHTESVYRLYFTADNKTLLSSSGDSTVKWWSVDSGGPVVTLPLPQYEQVSAWIWLKDSQHLVVARNAYRSATKRQESVIELWNTRTGELERTIGTHLRKVRSMAVSPDQRWLLSGSNDHTVKLWDLQTGKEVRTQFKPYTGDLEPWQEANIESAAFSPDGSKYVIGKGDGTVQLFDRETGNEVWKKQAVVPQHWTTFYNGKQRMGEPHAVHSIQWTSDGKTLVLKVGRWGSGLFLWDAATGENRFESEDLSPFRDEFPMAMSPDHKTIYYVGVRNDGGTLYAVDIESAKVQFQQPGFPSGGSLVVSRDGKTLAASGSVFFENKEERGCVIFLFDLTTKQLTAKLKGHEGDIAALAFVADPVLGNARQRLVSGSYDHTVKIWDVQSGQEFLSLPLSSRQGDRVEHLSVSPDGLCIAGTNGMDQARNGGNAVRIWSAKPTTQLPAIDPDESGLTPLERDLKKISQSLWVNEKTSEAWDTLTEEEKKFIRERWDKIVLDVQPIKLFNGDRTYQSHRIEPKYYTSGKEEPSYITLWGGGLEEKGKRYLVIPNRDKKEYRIEYELKGDTLRLKGKLYWIEPGQGIIMAPWVFDGEYTATPRP